jgi:N-succinyldiaminopimelate aminotransferase
MPFQPAARVAAFGASVFTEVTELAARYQAVDLSTGFPNVDGPAAVKAAAIAALEAGRNQYALSHGVDELRLAVTEHSRRFYGQSVNPNTEITITNGAASICARLFGHAAAIRGGSGSVT